MIYGDVLGIILISFQWMFLLMGGSYTESHILKAKKLAETAFPSFAGQVRKSLQKRYEKSAHIIKIKMCQRDISVEIFMI